MTTSLSDRVATLRRYLRGATTYDQAMLALSTADTVTLRSIEPDYCREPVSAASVTSLRESIAQAHVQRVANRQATDTDQVSPELVTAWAYTALAEWLPGATDFDARFGGQYTVRAMGIDAHTGGQRYRVTTPDGADPREFVITVAVTS